MGRVSIFQSFSQLFQLWIVTNVLLVADSLQGTPQLLGAGEVAAAPHTQRLQPAVGAQGALVPRPRLGPRPVQVLQEVGGVEAGGLLIITSLALQHSLGRSGFRKVQSMYHVSVYLVTRHVEGTLEVLLAGEHLLLSGDAPPRVLHQAHAQLAAVAGAASLHTAAAAGEGSKGGTWSWSQEAAQ